MHITAMGLADPTGTFSRSFFCRHPGVAREDEWISQGFGCSGFLPSNLLRKHQGFPEKL